MAPDAVFGFRMLAGFLFITPQFQNPAQEGIIVGGQVIIRPEVREGVQNGFRMVLRGELFQLFFELFTHHGREAAHVLFRMLFLLLQDQVFIDQRKREAIFFLGEGAIGSRTFSAGPAADGFFEEVRAAGASQSAHQSVAEQDGIFYCGCFIGGNRHEWRGR
ncbi:MULTISPECIES: hypothetical protein [unclassified Akkermansia]|uniref:hypothetical protein n=1 Tax=unclassified Akkermansia TaxID=2608915 RepID=UPI001F0015B3|nr:MULTISPECIES: hypothetical protein [unclassified Akkermansia]